MAQASIVILPLGGLRRRKEHVNQPSYMSLISLYIKYYFETFKLGKRVDQE